LPRTAAQARTLDSCLQSLGMPLTTVVLFTINDEVVVQRMLNRHRADDTEDTVRVRLKLYHEASRELIAHYKKQGLVHELNADHPVEHLYVKVAGILLSGKPD